MAHFAELDNNNKVLRVIVIDNDVTHNVDGVEDESLGIAYCKNMYGESTNWVQTSYNANFRHKYAGIDDVYLVDRDAFVTPHRFASWSLDENNEWQPPIPMPPKPENPLEYYEWDEQEGNWVFQVDEPYNK